MSLKECTYKFLDLEVPKSHMFLAVPYYKGVPDKISCIQFLVSSQVIFCLLNDNLFVKCAKHTTDSIFSGKILANDVLRLPIGVDATVGEDLRGEVGELDEAVDRRPHGVSLAGAGHPGEREGAHFHGLRTEGHTHTQ